MKRLAWAHPSFRDYFDDFPVESHSLHTGRMIPASDDADGRGDCETEEPVRTEKLITRAMLRAEPETLFVFGDNMARGGRGGQAKEMRGEPNAVGIPTKWSPGMGQGDFFSDANGDLDRCRNEIDAAFGRLFMHAAHGGEIVWPDAGIGTGLAELPKRAPTILAYIERGRKELRKI